MGRMGRKGEYSVMGSPEGEYVTYETSEILSFPDVSFGSQGSSCRFAVMGEGQDVSGQHSVTQTRRVPAYKGLC